MSIYHILLVYCHCDLFFIAGEYSFCFDNGMSRYSSKVVYFYLLSYADADWEKFAEEVQQLHGGLENFTASCILLLKPI